MQSGYTARHLKNRKDYIFRIVHWPEGYYTFFFEAGKTVSFADYLQDTLEFAKEVAEEFSGDVKLDWFEEAWVRELR